MNTNRILSTLVALSTVAALGASSVGAAAEPASAAVTVAAKSLTFLGSAVPDSAVADATITINADTQYVNVTGGDTVRFIVGGQSFAWSFRTGGTHIAPFDLARLAPAGALKHKVIVYVANDPLYLG